MTSTTVTRDVTSAPGSHPRPRPVSQRPRLHRLVRGRPGDPAWARPALLGLLLATALLYAWDLGASGNANSFYAAAVQAGSESWKAWFFGSLDSASSITVDKPPASLWVMGLSARVFGYSSWSLLLPQALEGVAAVALLHAAVRRVAGARAGLLAGALLALTPAAVMMFRFDNPDALLVLLVVAATYCLTRALEDGRTRWLLLTGVAIGFGFLTKSGQALLVVPALGAAYLLAGPHTWLRRVRQLLLGLLAIVVSSGWYLLTVALWPAADRPYIGGSTSNSAWELAFGYNGLARLFGGAGNGGGGGGGTGGNTSFGGATGLGRMFTGEFALEISWLLPAALLGIVALVWLTRRSSRRDPLRAATVVWGGSLLLTAGVFSFMQGTIHPYYSVALAPSIAALVALAAQQLWSRRGVVPTAFLAAGVVITAVWAVVLLQRNNQSTLMTVVVAVLAGLAVLALVARAAGVATGRLLPAVALVTALAVAVPTAAWGVRTAGTPHTGSIPTAVASTTASAGHGFGAGGSVGGGDDASSTALVTALQKSTSTWSAATVGAQSAAQLELSSDTAVIAIGGFSGSDASPTLAQFKALVAAGKVHYFVVGGQGGQGGPGSTSGSTSGNSSGSTSGSTSANSSGSTSANSSGSTSGAPTGAPSGEAPSGTRPSGGAGGPGGSSGTGSAITSWVESHFTAKTIGGQTVYDLTDPS